MRVLLALALGAWLAGCARARPVPVPVVETVEVRVPVAAPCPPPPAAVRPLLPVARIDSTTSDGEVAQLYAATVLVLQGYAAELERLLDAYRPRSDSTRLEAPVRAGSAGLEAPVRRLPGAPSVW